VLTFLQLLHAGIVASFRQFMAVLALTSAVLLTVPSDRGLFLSSAKLLLLSWSYVVVAAGLALTNGQSIDLTVARLHRASYISRRVVSKSALIAVAVQFGLAAILFSILALRHPPEAIVMISELCGVGPAISIVWPALMSIGAAGFGATAYASVKAIEVSNDQ
jgi:hypothetical protein